MGLIRNHRSGLLLAVAATAVSARVVAAAELADAVIACAELSDDERRLACYDRAVAGAQGTPSTPGTTAVEAPVGQEPRKDTAGAVEQFGMTPELARRVDDEDADGSSTTDHLEAVVVRIDERPRGERVVFLDIGQVWEEKSLSRDLRLAVGDRVIVRSGVLGSFRLSTRDSNRYTRVERIR